MNRTVLITILLSTFLLVGCGETAKVKNKSSNNFKKPDWPQCPQPNFNEISWDGIEHFDINNKKELKIFISSIVDGYKPSPMPKNNNNQWGKTIPIILEPNQNCDGVVFTSVQTKTSDITEEELNAWRAINEGIGNISNARNICNLQVIPWMKDYGYTVRQLIVSEKDELISDTTYDYDLCSHFIVIDNYE